MVAVHEDGHEGVQRTLHRLRRDFHFPNMKQLVQDLMRVCAVCQRYKSEHLHPAGLLLPLPVPQGVWTDIALNFIEALPKVRGKSIILTVVDRFSKYCHFIPPGTPVLCRVRRAGLLHRHCTTTRRAPVHGVGQGSGLHIDVLA